MFVMKLHDARLSGRMFKLSDEFYKFAAMLEGNK